MESAKMKNRKILLLLSIAALLAAVAVPVFAAPTEVAYTSGSLTLTDGSAAGQEWIMGTFNVTADTMITRVDVTLYRTNATGNHYHLYVYEWNEETTSIVGSALGFGEVEYAVGLGDGYLMTNFTLTPQPVIEANTKYCYVIDDTLEDFVYRRIGAGMSENGGTNFTSLCSIDADLVGWTDLQNVNDMLFTVWGTTAYVGSGDTPGGIWSGGSYDSLITAFVAFIVPLFVVLLPALLLIVITRKADKWIILIGLTIGAGLGYYFSMVPLWLVFLITIGLIGMAYQSVRGGG